MEESPSERFGKVPRKIETTIETTEDPQRLARWLTRSATARTLDEVGITSE